MEPEYDTSPRRILFVCLGNICRSPAAEGVMRDMLAVTGRGAQVVLDSAGTGGWHIGDPPYGPMQLAARSRGIDLSQLRARQFTAADFARFDLIVAMDQENRNDIERQRPAGSKTPVVLFTDYAPDRGVGSVPDPYFTGDFDGALDLIEACAKGLIDRL